MRIYIFAEYYPTAYKPYFDSQFAQLLSDGHELVILSAGQMGRVQAAKVVRHQLQRYVSHYPTTLRTLWRYLPLAAGRALAHPTEAAHVFRGVTSSRLRARLATTVRALSLPGEAPDCCLVHNLTTAVLHSQLRRAFPGSVLALYYHGGEVPVWSEELPAEAVRAALGQFDLVFTCTRFSARQIIERGCAATRVRVLPVGYDLADFRPRAVRSYRSEGSLRLVSAGRLSPEKGLQVAIAALGMLGPEELRGIEYRIVGDGIERARLESQTRELGLTNVVRFVGGCTPVDTLSELGSADALLLPSVPVGNAIENQACVVQEALLMKTPVVTSRIGGVQESIPDFMRPFSFEHGDVAGLRDHIRHLLTMDAAEFAALGEAGREWARAHYDIVTLNRRMIEEIELARRTPGRQEPGGADSAAPAPQPASGSPAATEDQRVATMR